MPCLCWTSTVAARLADSKVRLQYSVAYQLMKPLQAPVAVELKAAEAQGQSSPALPLQVPAHCHLSFQLWPLRSRSG